MNILYVGYWGANEGLSQATINPHLKILLNHNLVETLIYVSFERESDSTFHVPQADQFIHIPLKADKFPFRLLNKVYEVVTFSKKLIFLAKKYNIDLVICRSSLSGNYGLAIHQRLKVPFTVESFEPHAEYMRELGIWKKSGPSYQYQRKQEEKQKKYAYKLYPVAENYRKKLIDEGVPEKRLRILPCAVNHERFSFSEADRHRIRSKLNISKDAVTAIYVGKFGGIYFSINQALEIFQKANDYFKDFHLIILTSDYQSVYRALKRTEFPVKRVSCMMVPHSEVSAHLSASDFAFSLINSTNFSAYCSPIKNGEYWANGLPILIPSGIGDDSNIVKISGLGVVMDDDENLQNYFMEIMRLIEQKKHRQAISKLAIQYRSYEQIADEYNDLLISYKRENIN